MALFGKDDKNQRFDEPSIMTSSPAPSRTTESSHADESVQAHLGKGSRVEGKLTFEASVKIDGQVEGEISAQDTVIVGENAVVTAQITAGTIVIRGKVTGDIVARKRVELRAPGKVVGNIHTPTIVIHEGVFFEGHCSMTAADAKSDRGDKKIALFPKEGTAPAAPVRMTSEAGK
jgi:cytoskeletal protein CcmA (bactofilin family)